MKYKTVIGTTALFLGVLSLILSFYIRDQVSTELGKVKKGTDVLQNNPFTKAGGRTAKKATGQTSKAVNQMAANKAAPYATTANWTLFAGIILIVGGGCVFVFGRSKH
jgi:uncharacterized membrane protein HdeD (DUF308 family)